VSPTPQSYRTLLNHPHSRRVSLQYDDDEDDDDAYDAAANDDDEKMSTHSKHLLLPSPEGILHNAVF
jgi:hypothetical protein